MLVMLWATAVAAQPVPVPVQGPGGGGSGDMRITGTMIGDIFSGIGSFGGGGELPVRDAEVRSTTALELLKVILILQDALKQAVMGVTQSNERTAGVIAAQAAYGEPGSLLYGQYDPAQWDDLYKEDTVFPHGGWLEEERARQHRRLSTQKDLMVLLKMRQDEFVHDAARIAGLKGGIDGSRGRNQAIQAAGAAQVEVAWQSLQHQQLEMTIANAQAVANGGQVNEQMAREAQERAFLRDYDRPVQRVQFQERGLPW
jgi:hypothetical protein